MIKPVEFVKSGPIARWFWQLLLNHWKCFRCGTKPCALRISCSGPWNYGVRWTCMDCVAAAIEELSRD